MLEVVIEVYSELLTTFSALVQLGSSEAQPVFLFWVTRHRPLAAWCYWPFGLWPL